MPIHLIKEGNESIFLNPMNNFSESSVYFEIRKDPLTKETSRIVPETGIEFQKTEDFSEMIKESKGCFFCEENVESDTPKFKKEIVEDGRIKAGSVILFPNIFPYGRYSGVCAFKEHFIPMNEFSAELIGDALTACKIFAENAYKNDKTAKYCTINWNFLPPAGSSILHPHIQPLIDSSVSNYHRLLLYNSKKYFSENGRSSYWRDIVDVEIERDERYIGKTGSVEWITPFAPRGHFEIIGITNSPDYISLSDEEIMDIATGISKILEFYDTEGRSSFNMSIYSGIFGNTEDKEYFLTNIHIIARSNMQRYYMNDANYLRMLLNEPVVSTSPEEVCKRIQNLF
jgi:galactose-1-phosphate uridylyltransferase